MTTEGQNSNNLQPGNSIKSDVVRSYDEQKERLLSLFTEDAKKSIVDKHFSVETLTTAGKEIHIIYIADDEWIKDFYKKEFVKEPKPPRGIYIELSRIPCG